ncbi:MAG: hypothetical protein H7268_14220, partial [Sandarakinorhabdus sp.]|nr:hypothetical protein [Sandarakinorhabdus sp.]
MADDPAQLNSAGLRALHQGDAATAAVLLARAAAADPASPLLWYNLSMAQRATGDTLAEIQALDNALDRDPYFDHALLARGRVCEDRDDAAGALGYYERLLAAHDPRVPHGPGFAAGLAAARALVEAHQQSTSGRIDAALAPALAATADADSVRFRHFVDASLGRRKIYVH